MFTIQPGTLTLSQIEDSIRERGPFELSKPSYDAIAAAQATVQKIVSEKRTVYGINTGFGLLAQKQIAPDELRKLQVNLVLSHAAATPYHVNVINARIIFVR